MRPTRTALLLCLVLALPSAWAEKIMLRIGKQTAHAEIADTPQSRERGLMQRDHLCADCGMLFVFEKADRYNFWMKDTPLPLSIAFIAANGAIINIAEMQPDTTDVHSAKRNALYALEMNSGWFARNGIKPGDRVRGLKQASKTHSARSNLQQAEAAGSSNQIDFRAQRNQVEQPHQVGIAHAHATLRTGLAEWCAIRRAVDINVTAHGVA